MFVPQNLEGFRPQHEDSLPAAGAQRRRQDDVAARRLDASRRHSLASSDPAVNALTTSTAAARFV